MNVQNTDCLIVGAGPAGAAAALALARAGRSVVLLDAAPFPRAKVCGGGLNPRAMEALGLDLTPVLGPRVSRVRFTWCGEEPVEAELPPEAAITMVYREPFDALLAASAQHAGADFRPACPVSDLRRERGHWTGTTPQGPVSAPFLIVADGGKGRLAAQLGFRVRRRLIPAMEAEPRCNLERSDTLHMDFGLAPGGYAWAFPKAEGWNLGAGAFPGGKGLDLREASRAMGRLVDFQGELKLLGHPIALWDGPSVLHGDGVLVAGEAAALVDPFTAEGIRPALLSGMLAGDAVDRALRGDARALEGYSDEIRDWGVDFAWARRLATVFYRFPRAAYRVGVRHPGAPERMARLFSGELRYRDVAARALQRLTAGMLGSR